jgi:hypothetical protein
MLSTSSELQLREQASAEWPGEKVKEVRGCREYKAREKCSLAEEQGALL